MSAMTMMTDDEVRRTESAGPEAGFGRVRTELGNLPVKALDVRTRISGLVFEVVMRQTYRNGYERPLEATYIFPLPDRAAVSDFRMFVGPREIRGELKERGEARRQYQEAIEQGHRASIVEEERPDVFTMRVGNIEPGEEITVEFTLTGPLIFADGEATFRFPLVVAPRYVPGTPLGGGDVGTGTSPDTDAVPDASRITPPTLLEGFPNPIALSLSVELAPMGMEISDVRSSLHAVTESTSGGARVFRIRPGERVNRDFILRFAVGGEDVVTDAVMERDEEGKEGTLMVTIVPPRMSVASKPRDVVFVLDRSGSMEGWKMVAARRALGRMLDTLGPEDRFQVIAFDTVSEPMEAGLVNATNRNRYRAIEHLSKIDARGGTEMAEPLLQAVDMLGSGYEDRQRMVVLVTDGQVGNEGQIVAEIQRRKTSARIHTVGIDQAVAAGFLNRLAELGGGRCELVESEDRLDEAMTRIHRAVGTPAVTELRVALDGAELDPNSVVPHRPVDLFEGAVVRVMGRCRGTGGPRVRISGQRADGTPFERTVAVRTEPAGPIRKLWARGRVRHLEDRYAAAASPGLNDEIVATSLRFGVLCRFTSWVAIDREAKVDGEGLRQVTQPVEKPQGWGSRGAGMTMAGALPQMPTPRMAPMAAAPAGGFSVSDGMVGGGFDDDVEAEGWSGGPPQPTLQASFEMAPEAPSKKRKEQARSASAKGMATPAPPADRELASSDVSILGMLGYQLLTGEAPIVPQVSIGMNSDGSPVWPNPLENVLDPSNPWSDILRRTTSHDPAEKFAGPSELLAAVETSLGRGADSLPRGPATLRELASSGLEEQDALALWVAMIEWVIAFYADRGAPCDLLRRAEAFRVSAEGELLEPVTAGEAAGEAMGKLKRAADRLAFWK